MKKEKIHLEYLLNATSKNILWGSYQYTYRVGGLVCRQSNIR